MGNKRQGLYWAVVIGVSTGGVQALKYLFSHLPADFPLPILVVSHIMPAADDGLAVLLNSYSPLTVKEADEGEGIQGGWVYLAPANYHLLVERGGGVSLSVDPPVNYARPSVDVLFESAAEVYGRHLIGVLLTGAGHDGSYGIARIKEHGGCTIVQNPDDAEMRSMPQRALEMITPAHICTLHNLPDLLTVLAEEK